jgi:excisionase family DNA binding protein
MSVQVSLSTGLAMNFMTVKETARLLRVSPITIRRHIASGRLPAERFGLGIRVRRKAIEGFISPVVSLGESKGPTDWSRKPSGYADEDLAEIGLTFDSWWGGMGAGRPAG